MTASLTNATSTAVSLVHEKSDSLRYLDALRGQDGVSRLNGLQAVLALHFGDSNRVALVPFVTTPLLCLCMVGMFLPSTDGVEARPVGHRVSATADIRMISTARA